MAATHNVVSGPNKLALMLALFDSTSTTLRHVTFVVESQRPHPQSGSVKRDILVGVTGVDAEDGSGDSWIVRGWIPGDCPRTFEVYYRTDTRKGVGIKIDI